MTKPNLSSDSILLAHGGGGQLSEDLIRQVILPRLSETPVETLTDAAQVSINATTVCMTTDSYVVKPLFFPGGDIGKLAVCGTVNDLAVAGAEPIAISLALIIEEGFARTDLERIMDSVGQTAGVCGVTIVTGDTKTVETGSADGIFINTTGIGRLRPGIQLGFDVIGTGDVVLVSGTLGDHGLTIMSQREDIRFESSLRSDCAPLAGMIEVLLRENNKIRFMRDPTRGGLAASLNEIARATGHSLLIRQSDLPINGSVQAAADMLGFDILNIANEGKFVAVVAAEQAQHCLDLCHQHPLGKDARLIGEIGGSSATPLVELETNIGGRRIVQMPYGRDLPRIC
ncbi:hydrogenase expression/formation protein HypE [Planctomycetota bacterium]